VPARETYAPTRLPDRIVLTWAGDPARSQAVTWRTSTDVDQAFAEIAVSEGGPHFREHARRLEAATEPFQSDLSICHVHSVCFKNLEPDTTYIYRVGDGTNWSEWFQFRTACAGAAPFSFVYFGDAQNEVKSMWSRVIRQAHLDAPKAAFMLHAGDLIDRATSDKEWGEWFSAGGWLNGMIPVVPTPGNHEYYSMERPDGSRERRLSPHWRNQFTLPENGPEGLEETVYYVDYQGTRIISLNSNERQESQVEWLTGVLENNPSTWTVIAFHHPIYSMAKDRDNPRLRELWKPVFDRFKVDLVLTGHDHTYGRTGLVGDENVASGTATRSRESGTVYVVSVSGPKQYKLDPVIDTLLRRTAEQTQLYQVISIDGSTLRYETRMATGELYDAFLLRKRAGQSNQLTEQVPDTPERRTRTEPLAIHDTGG
jgi:3',5'-cyclic AMP phosphodiesterase CpdA